MKWEVRGALRDTGEDTIIFIEADTRESAERRAGRRGMVVESVESAEPAAIGMNGDSVAGDALMAEIQAEARNLPQRPRAESRAEVAARMSGNGHVAPAKLAPGQCANCGSTQTMSAEMIVMQGTSVGSFGGVGVDADGDIGVVGGSTKSRTALAELYAAPTPITRIGLVIGIVLAGLSLVCFLLYLGDPKDSAWERYGVWICFPLLLAGLAFYCDRGPAKFNAEEHPKLMAQWRRTWCCLRCGHRFVR